MARFRFRAEESRRLPSEPLPSLCAGPRQQTDTTARSASGPLRVRLRDAVRPGDLGECLSTSNIPSPFPSCAAVFQRGCAPCLLTPETGYSASQGPEQSNEAGNTFGSVNTVSLCWGE